MNQFNCLENLFIVYSISDYFLFIFVIVKVCSITNETLNGIVYGFCNRAFNFMYTHLRLSRVTDKLALKIN